MNKTYTPNEFETAIYNKWLEKNYFSAEPNKEKKPFCIIMPPPNVTGQLHIGHALGDTIQDAIIRYKRMKGFETLWIPGTDHASIATEVKIIEVLRDEGITKEELGREGFLKRAFEWKDKYGGKIVEQIKTLGCSCDWDRLAFTMDEERSRSVKQVFINLYKKGLIFKGNRIINWCPECHTAISDAEVEYVEDPSHLWHIAYPVTDSNEKIIVATTRPETILGDTAVAVHPSDKRYKHLVGKTVDLPLTDRKIPIIADSYVEKDFGTGAVKITPAHDPNDFNVGKRHDLPLIKIMDESGILNENAGIYNGLDRDEARKQIVKDLSDRGFLVKTEDYNHNVGHCYRCHTVIEPMVSEQWFVKMDELVKPAIDAVKKRDITFIPKRFEKQYLHWMENTQDWCISRQLWWGHRIPVFYCDDCGETIATVENKAFCPKCGKPMRQDEDVLDTWFSSALWPFSTMGWPEKTPDLEYFYPTSVLVTAYDIIGFWVSRMIFSGLNYTGKKPFSDVLIHGIVRDAHGKKMSKSSGNGVDPLEVIRTVGADTLRFSLVNGIAMGGDIKYSEEKQEGYRNFMNKIWNAARFVLGNCDGAEIIPIEKVKKTLADKWILAQLNSTVVKVTKYMDKYEIGLASAELYEFVWNIFCDWYIEFSKTSLYSDDLNKRNSTISVLLYVLRETLKLLHPIIPFITAEIYNELPNKDAEDIMISPYPTAKRNFVSNVTIKKIRLITDTIRSIRNMRAELNVPQSKRTEIYIKPNDGVEDTVKAGINYIEKLASGNGVHIVDKAPQGNMNLLVTEIGEIYIPMDQLIDFEKERERLNKEMEKVDAEIERAQSLLSKESFVSKAPALLIQKEREKLQKYTDMKKLLTQKLEMLK